MPEFRLRIWAEQVLFDCRDYVVTADTLEAAAKKLLDAQEKADDRDCDVEVDGIVSATLGRMDAVLTLDPEEIVSGEVGVTLIDGAGERVRDLIGVPTCCDQLGEPL